LEAQTEFTRAIAPRLMLAPGSCWTMSAVHGAADT
jgi:hypothetical protein